MGLGTLLAYRFRFGTNWSGYNMKDIQNRPDTRKKSIDKVGVRNIPFPLILADRKNGFQHTVALVNMYVDLPHHFKGTHMSRFVEVFEEHRGKVFNGHVVQDLLYHLKKKLNAKSAYVEIAFSYFIEKTAPISKKKSLMNYPCKFVGNTTGTTDELILEVNVPVKTLCPCSKEISDRGAHNQRSIVTVRVKFKDFVWIEELVTLVEKEASSELYTLLKRSDEKHVTERAYDNPLFVEDMVRAVSIRLDSDSRITWYSVESENFESIHNHNAYALIQRTKI